MKPNTSKRLIIFEGPDGVGKTTLSRRVADDIGAFYVHLGAFGRIKDPPLMARMYLEAMMPAILGHADVVMDRSWVSEEPYGIAYRNGADRLGLRSRLLERLAWRCQTTIVKCTADWEVVRDNFNARRGQELLQDETQLREVYDWYRAWKPDLPHIEAWPIDMTVTEGPQFVFDEMLFASSTPHNVEPRTTGNLLGKALLVGEGFGDIAQGDPLYQSPFGSFVGSGCSLWLTQQLDAAGIPESALMWANANQLTDHIKNFPTTVIALGTRAAGRLAELGRESFLTVSHPQNHKRFHFNEEYPLIRMIEDILS